MSLGWFGKDGKAPSRMLAKMAVAACVLAGALVLAACSQSGSSTMMGTGSTSSSASGMASGSASSMSDSMGMDSMGMDSSGTATEGDGYKTISAADAKMMIDNGGVTVVDVRPAEQYAEKRLPGAISIPLESIGTSMPSELPDLDATIILYCNTTARSAQAAQKLADMGYTSLYNMEGGISAWTYGYEQ